MKLLYLKSCLIGNFFTGNSRTGVIKIWNVSQKAPIDTLRITDCGIHAAVIGNSQTAALIAGSKYYLYCMKHIHTHTYIYMLIYRSFYFSK